MPSVFLLGGTGQIGRAAADHFSAKGWEVTLASRTAPPDPGPWRHVAVDRSDTQALTKAFSEGADLLVDCIAFDAGHARQLLALQHSAGRIAAISSASVYKDAQSRTLDEAKTNGFPALPVPVPEDHPTVAPGPATYSTRKIAMEQTLLDTATVPVTILRPCAIHGPHSKHAREWWVLKRLLDRRKTIPLNHNGESRFQTTAASAIAAALDWAATGAAPPILNVTDADAPSTAEIARTIMAHTGLTADLHFIHGATNIGQTPWSAARPFVCASSFDWRKTYSESVPAALSWLTQATHTTPWQTLLPQLAAYTRDHFDYTAEDVHLAP